MNQTDLDHCDRYRVVATEGRIRLVMMTHLEQDGSSAVVYWDAGAMFVLPSHAFFDGRFKPANPDVERNDVEPPETSTRPKYRHVKTGGVYVLQCLAEMADDRTPVVVYSGQSGCWTRNAHEFWDGRFVLVEPGATLPDTSGVPDTGGLTHLPAGPATPKASAGFHDEPPGLRERILIEGSLRDSRQPMRHGRRPPGNRRQSPHGSATEAMIRAAAGGLVDQSPTRANDLRADAWRSANPVVILVLRDQRADNHSPQHPASAYRRCRGRSLRLRRLAHRR